MSLPVPAYMLSFPAPPLRVLLPVVAYSLSLPAPPSILSLPLPPSMLSLPFPPFIISPASEPVTLPPPAGNVISIPFEFINSSSFFVVVPFKYIFLFPL